VGSAFPSGFALALTPAPTPSVSPASRGGTPSVAQAPTAAKPPTSPGLALGHPKSNPAPPGPARGHEHSTGPRGTRTRVFGLPPVGASGSGPSAAPGPPAAPRPAGASLPRPGRPTARAPAPHASRDWHARLNRHGSSILPGNCSHGHGHGPHGHGPHGVRHCKH
jgi:hypothetical protein